MRLLRCCNIVLAAALLTHASGLAAQVVAVDSTMPRAGTWGAEAMYGGVPAATLLRFSSPSAAWLIGASFSMSRETSDDVIFTSPTASSVVTETRVTSTIDARLGRRWWAGDARSRLQPLRGLGLAGSYVHYPSMISYLVGAYGELGATWFFTPHVSLGASGELLAGYGQDRLAVGTSPDQVTTRWQVRGNLVRVAAGVYF
jgi:hypothetical protein